MICPSERVAALEKLVEFLPRVGAYARDRNAVVPGHAAVSRLSPAIRHRLLTESEVSERVLQGAALGRVEKFVQEVYWRRYWKACLSLRPELWAEYQIALERLMRGGGDEILARAERGDLGNAVIDYFARELVETGYLHNHARMWFAGWWIHEARWPWELGAAFFHAHLLDGDPASNVLSWRWVAGLQTPGKTYLARRSNLEKYLAKEHLAALGEGLAGFENPSPLVPLGAGRLPVTRPDLEVFHADPSLATGLWIHEEDLSVENSLLGKMKFQAVRVAGHVAGWDALGFPSQKQAWLRSALGDAAARAEAHWQVPVTQNHAVDLVGGLVGWARAVGLAQVLALRPEVGPLADWVAAQGAELESAGIRLVLLDRPEDVALRPLASGGFFQFWEKLLKRGWVAGAPAQQLSLDF
jgi:deoxyribodipyrimidine photo-lyase